MFLTFFLKISDCMHNINNECMQTSKKPFDAGAAICESQVNEDIFKEIGKVDFYKTIVDSLINIGNQTIF